jgi:hypothetical protein
MTSAEIAKGPNRSSDERPAVRWPWGAPEIKPDQPADAIWIVGDVQRRSFDSVTDAACFVMEEIAEPHRASAWITIEDGSLTTEHIKQLYKTRRPAKL